MLFVTTAPASPIAFEDFKGCKLNAEISPKVPGDLPLNEAPIPMQASSITLISIMGLVFLYSASQGNLNVVIKQSLFVFFGLILMFILSQPDPDFYKSNALVFFGASLVLIILTLLVGKEANGAKRWLRMNILQS